MSSDITAERLTSLFRPRSVALVGASDKSAVGGAAIEALDAVVTWTDKEDI